MRRTFALLALVLSTAAHADWGVAPWGAGQSRAEDLEISLVTFGVGDPIFEWFGHTALVVEDKRLGDARLYNYGMFDFTKFAAFALGRLEFYVAEAGYAPTLKYYALYENRDVRIQILNLTDDEKLALAKSLSDNVQPANRDYLYHHYNDNCATRPRDMLDKVLGGQLHASTKGPARMTLRGHTRKHASVLPAMAVLLDFMMNDEIDRPIAVWDEAFLPAELEAQVGALRYKNSRGEEVPLVARQATYYKSTRTPLPEDGSSYAGWLLLLGLLLGAIPVALTARVAPKRPRLARVGVGLWNVGVGIVFGLPGLVLLLMWIITNHTVTWHNENLLLANPITFAALPLGVMFSWGSQRARRALRFVWYALAATGALAIAVKVIPVCDQNNWNIIALILPVSLGGAAAVYLAERARRSQADATSAVESRKVVQLAR